jgi:hypothetical protein
MLAADLGCVGVAETTQGESDVLFTSEDTKLPHPIHPCLHSFEGELLQLTYLIRLQLEIDGSSVSAEKTLEIPVSCSYFQA